jgi:hypothetical protein
VRDTPSQQAIGAVIEKISSWSELSGAQFAGEKLVKSDLKYNPNSISNARVQVRSWSVKREKAYRSNLPQDIVCSI